LALGPIRPGLVIFRFIYPDTFIPPANLGLSIISATVLLQCCLPSQWQQFEPRELLSPPDILNKPLDSSCSNPYHNYNFTWEAIQFAAVFNAH